MEEKKKVGIKLKRLSAIPLEELKKIKLNDLWVMEPREKWPDPKARLCGSGDTCFA
ncbi:MAG: hypothetical protein ACFFCE_07195 [Promethearchaeota archaeon]